jgi:hypothetical protein
MAKSNPKLHQIVAIEADIRNQSTKDLTDQYHKIQKADALIGLYHEYQPVREDGEKFDAERRALQVRLPEVLEEVQRIMIKQVDIVATRDIANTAAKADIVLDDGTVLAMGLPSPFLLWLEKKLDDLHAVATKLPTLPADTEWEWNKEQYCFKNKHEVKTTKTSKIQEPLVLYQATDKHPAQTQLITRDQTIGHWNKNTYHGALPVAEVKAFKERVEKLQKAVKLARERANQVEAPEQNVGANILNYIFSEVLRKR